MLPIAVLPVASLPLRLGQPDLLDIAFMSAAGQAVLANLGLPFAVGVAVGLDHQDRIAGQTGKADGLLGWALALTWVRSRRC